MYINTNINRQSAIQCGDLFIDPQCYIVRLSGKEISLYPKEFNVLLLLVQHPGWVLSTEQIYQTVWENDVHDCEHIVYNTVCQIRKKLGRPQLIRTVIRCGYKFVG